MGKQANKIFEPNDGRTVSSDLLILRKGQMIEIYSTGWDCDRNDKITPYVIFNFPSNPQCEEPLADVFVEDCEVDCHEIQQRPVFELTRSRRYAKITKPGSYFLHRTCGAETVTVWYKRTNC